jgi:phosphatidylglycerophosphatase C
MDVEMDHVRHSINPGIDLQKNEDVMKRRIAFLDFDGTITTKDSLLAFIFYRYGRWRTYIGLLSVSISYVAYILKLIPVQAAKESVLRRFFRNEKIEEFQSACERFIMEILPTLLRPKALNEIELLQELGAEVVIISASPCNWIQPWSKSIGATPICSVLEVIDGKLTGKIQGNNCRGKEKVIRINNSYKLEDYDEVYAYGDTKGDKPMLELATFAFYKPFR